MKTSLVPEQKNEKELHANLPSTFKNKPDSDSEGQSCKAGRALLWRFIFSPKMEFLKQTASNRLQSIIILLVDAKGKGEPIKSIGFDADVCHCF